MGLWNSITNVQHKQLEENRIHYCRFVNMYMHIHVLFLWWRHENMFPGAGSRVIVNCKRTVSRSQRPLPPTTAPRVLTTRPLPIRWKRIDTSRMVLQAVHNSEPILDRNDSPLGALQLALAYKYHFCMETWKHLPMHWQLGKCQMWANCFVAWSIVFVFACVWD